MIVVGGEALFDVFVGADTATGLALDARVGGSPFNVAVGLARLGRDVAFFGGVSTGPLGERLLRALRDEGVATATAARIDAPTTLGLVGLDAAGVPSYAFYGDRAADRLLGDEALALLPADVAALHLGSFSLVVEPTGSTLRRLAEARRGRSLVSIDPNVRLNVEPDVDRWRRLLEWAAAHADLLKISAEDLGLLEPGRDAAAFARDALARGASLVVVTRGGDGAAAWTAAASADVGAERVDVVDTVGAGDSFQAALLAWLDARDALHADALRTLTADDLAAALRHASRAAAVTCSRRGADLPRRADLG